MILLLKYQRDFLNNDQNERAMLARSLSLALSLTHTHILSHTPFFLDCDEIYMT